jgi:hypothetical protein
MAAMEDIDLEARIPTYVDPQTHQHVGVIAVLSEEEFAWAQIIIPDLSSYLGYEDWLDCREGFEVGLAMAGVDVKKISVVLSPYLAWCRLTGAQPSERSLDAFASMLLFLRKHPAPIALAVVREEEFVTHARAVEAFTPHVDFEHWKAHRAAVQQTMSDVGVRIEPLPVNVRDFIEWGRCVRTRTSEAILDNYAELVLEFLRDEERR